MCRYGMGRVGYVPSLLCAELTWHPFEVKASLTQKILGRLYLWRRALHCINQLSSWVSFTASRLKAISCSRDSSSYRTEARSDNFLVSSSYSMGRIPRRPYIATLAVRSGKHCILFRTPFCTVSSIQRKKENLFAGSPLNSLNPSICFFFFVFFFYLLTILTLY